ncbi:MAG: hypothetical protein R2932_57375 [Caldilineaceae bacterium]
MKANACAISASHATPLSVQFFTTNYMIVPTCDTQIEQGDRTVVFALPQAIDELDYLFGR